MKNIMDKINNLDFIDSMIKELIEVLFFKGAVDAIILQKLACIKFYQPKLFSKYENEILVKMGLFFKPLQIENLTDLVFKIHWDYIKEVFEDRNFTPTQGDIISKIKKNKAFAFSSPTSTGKSFVFRYLINMSDKDLVFIVPSRALINEYYKNISEIVNDKNVNILTFVDIINKKHTTRNIFIITPERAKDLFLLKERLSIELFLFDEAQLSDEDSTRGMYYDSVVRRTIKYFSDSKFVFAYPFISNPEAQFTKNNIEFIEKESAHYENKNVGQLFYSYKENLNIKEFYIFGSDVTKTGSKMIIDFDPLEKVLKEGGTALIYCSKTSIYNKKILKKFSSYLKICKKVENEDALRIINEIREFIGASDSNQGDYFSEMISYMKQGIVLHHGSLPLRVRVLIEEFTQKRYANVCFATATLEQGINMPFDLVWIEYFERSKELGVKNLIGRAGRSTNKAKFDFGQIVIKNTSRTILSKILKKQIKVKEESELDILTDPNDDYKEYKESIKEGTFSEEYNLTNSEIKRIETTTIDIECILDLSFSANNLNFSNLNLDKTDKNLVINAFVNIYKKFLSRELIEAEEMILNTAVRILFWRVQGKKFNQIVNIRYGYAAQVSKRKELHKLIEENRNSSDDLAVKKLWDTIDKMPAQWVTMFQMIPDKNIKSTYININYDSSNSDKIKAKDLDYDRIVVDTYDYLDKLIGFRFGDVFFAAFDKYSKNETFSNAMRDKALKMAKYIKYGTDDEKEIWLLRYGFDFEDMDWLIPIVRDVNEDEILFNDLTNVELKHKDRIKKFIDWF